MIDVILLVIGGYFLAGIFALMLLDLLTGRVRGRVGAAAYETQTVTGGGRIVSVFVTVFALWLLWPAAIYAALFQRS